MASVLIVDDSAIIRDILRAMLEKSGHQVVGEAASGLEAVEMYRDCKPDLVTLDILMADGGGMTYLEELLAMDSDARVIMVTALGHDEKEQEARKLGALGYVTKPFQKSQLDSAVTAALQH